MQNRYSLGRRIDRNTYLQVQMKFRQYQADSELSFLLCSIVTEQCKILQIHVSLQYSYRIYNLYRSCRKSKYYLMTTMLTVIIKYLPQNNMVYMDIICGTMVVYGQLSLVCFSAYTEKHNQQNHYFPSSCTKSILEIHVVVNYTCTVLEKKFELFLFYIMSHVVGLINLDLDPVLGKVKYM